MLTALFSFFAAAVACFVLAWLWPPAIGPREHLELRGAHLKRTGILKVLGVAVAVVFYAGGALAAGDAATPASTDMLAKVTIHAVAVAGFIRAAIALLRSPILGFVWGRVPEPVRVIALVALGALAVAFDSIALGTPPLEALAAAFVGLFGAVGGHEMVKRVLPAKPPAKAR